MWTMGMGWRRCSLGDEPTVTVRLERIETVWEQKEEDECLKTGQNC